MQTHAFLQKLIVILLVLSSFILAPLGCERNPGADGPSDTAGTDSPDSAETDGTTAPAGTTAATQPADTTTSAVTTGSTVTAEGITYSFKNNRPGSADGVINITAPSGVSGYTEVTLYFADDAGVLAQYTHLAALPLTGGAASYIMDSGRALPREASRLCVSFNAEGKSRVDYWLNLPREKLFDAEEKPVFTFYAISDVHLQDYWKEIPVNRKRAVSDIQANKPDFVVINGDLVNQGYTSQYSTMTNFLKTNFSDWNIPAFITNGNHEFFVSDKNSLDYDRAALLGSFSAQLEALGNMGYDINRSGENLWYSTVIDGYRFIFLSTPTAPKADVLASGTVTQEQLAFLENELAESKKSKLPAFVFTHVPLKGYVPLRETTGIANTDKIVEILNRYPNTVVVSGHTHSNLSLDLPFVKVGNMSSTFTHLNDGCAIWLKDGKSSYGDYEVSFSAGQVIEVYEDKILVKARKFAAPCVFFGYGLYLVDIPGA